MKCAKLHLQERSKVKPITIKVNDKPRRYCQKRMVDPGHEEDPRWTDVFERFHCHISGDGEVDAERYGNIPNQTEDYIFLSVQNIKFQGDTQQRKRPRTSFKYKSLSDNRKHRMFVKQVVDDVDVGDDVSSQLSSYYFDDYVKYITNDRSRPSSSKSSLFLQRISNKYKENKAIQVDAKISDKKIRKDCKEKQTSVKVTKSEVTEDPLPDNNMENAKISFHKSGKRKSLTISRVPSPETVQIIRVDVVCNYSNSSMLSDCYDDNNKQTKLDNVKIDKDSTHNFKSSHFANKYLLTNTVKTLDENVSGGAKVTLLCKTFRLTDRSKQPSERKYSKTKKCGTGVKNPTVRGRRARRRIRGLRRGGSEEVDKQWDSDSYSTDGGLSVRRGSRLALATACDLDAKLKVTLLELKKSNELNKALLQERDESEIEIKLMSDKYVALKNDLVKISTDFEVLHIENEKLQEIVNKYDLCRDTYESALQKITHLERHLEEVQSQNKSLLDHRRLSSYNETMDLYTEMLNTTSDQTSALPLVTIDLTNTPSSYSPNKVPINMITYACESWTLTTERVNKLQVNQIAMERSMLGISLRDRRKRDSSQRDCGILRSEGARELPTSSKESRS
ncbi:uncharacterized protein LOC131853098 [Achroia grisella]|uniref:uncharacterized protein LOC131853098 n=1 Tax=Achroia grisella TaxID=688607 RepID=UPI0027D2E803|nr:uncharacterized protein LOC131853098 [Achroia grisella]